MDTVWKLHPSCPRRRASSPSVAILMDPNNLDSRFGGNDDKPGGASMSLQLRTALRSDLVPNSSKPRRVARKHECLLLWKTLFRLRSREQPGREPAVWMSFRLPSIARSAVEERLISNDTGRYRSRPVRKLP